MNPLGPLLEEHLEIRVVIDAISALLDQPPRRDRRLSPAPFLALQQFVARFADGTHHVKEEQVLYRELASAGLPRDTGRLGVLTNEHEEGRKYAAVIGAAARACLEGDWQRQPDMVEAARSWCALVAAHIQREEQGLFPLALRLIDPARLALLPELFACADLNPPGAFMASARAVVAAAEEAAHHRSAAGRPGSGTSPQRI